MTLLDTRPTRSVSPDTEPIRLTPARPEQLHTSVSDIPLRMPPRPATLPADVVVTKWAPIPCHTILPARRSWLPRRRPAA